jgi:hypothetical protein
MILRVYALYNRDRRVLLGLLLVLLAQITVQARVLLLGVCRSVRLQLVSGSQGTSLALDFPIPTGCILIGRSSLYTGLWIAPLFTDSSVFILTLLKSRQCVKQGAGMRYVIPPLLSHLALDA